MPSAMNLPVRDLKSSQETPIMTIELPDKMYPAILCRVECPMIRPQRFNALREPISGYQPQVGSDRVALINIAVRTLGNGQVQHIPAIFTMTQDLPRLLTVNNDCSAAASSPMHRQANHAPRVTPPIAHATCRNPDHIRNVYSSTIANPVKRNRQPRTRFVHTQPRR